MGHYGFVKAAANVFGPKSSRYGVTFHFLSETTSHLSFCEGGKTSEEDIYTIMGQWNNHLFIGKNRFLVFTASYCLKRKVLQTEENTLAADWFLRSEEEREKNRNQHSSKDTGSYGSVGIVGPTFLGVWGKLAACHVILQHWSKVWAPSVPLKD